MSGLRKKLGDDLPIRGTSTPSAASASASPAPTSYEPASQLLAAFAYVLILVIVALEVPLILNVSRRVDTRKSLAAADAQLVAASAGRVGHSRHPRPSPDRSARRRGCGRASSSSTEEALSWPTRVARTGKLRRQAGDPGRSTKESSRGAGSARPSVRRRPSRPCQSWSRAAPSAALSASRRASTPSTGRVRRDVLGLIGIGLIAHPRPRLRVVPCRDAGSSAPVAPGNGAARRGRRPRRPRARGFGLRTATSPTHSTT